MLFSLTPQKNIDILQPKAKVILILWALWSGKTHLLNSLLPYATKNTKVLVNDIGEISIDAKRIKSENVSILKDGCVCCEDIIWLKKALLEAKDEEYIFIEPSGIAGWDDIVNLVKKLWFDISVITLQDITHFDKRTPEEKHIIENQLKVSDIIWYTWIDENFESVRNLVDAIHPHVPSVIIPKSWNENISPNNSFEELLSTLSQKTKQKIEFILCDDNHNDHHISPHQNPLKTYSVRQEIQNWNFEALQSFLSQNTTIIRAKWVVENISFNYTHGNLEIEWWSESKNYANFITPETLEITHIPTQKNITFLQQKIVMISNPQEFQKKIDTLIEQYHEYMNLEAKIQSLKKDARKNALSINALQLKQKLLWESMKYDNPHIWLQYKIKAYAWQPNEVSTLGDLKEHAKSPTYICHKRLQFLAKYLKENFGKDIFDENLDQNMLIDDFLNWDDIKASLDEEFMKKWLGYEYFTINGKTAKWENFSL